MQKKRDHLPTAPIGLTRRNFLKRTGMAAAAAAIYFPYVGNVLGANDRINIACIGLGGQGLVDSNDAASLGGNIVAICDPDKNCLGRRMAGYAKDFPELKPQQFQDYRVMFEKMGKGIDAVTISTPDHHHGVAAIRSLKLGKHCFCQKPLAQTVHEARILRELAKDTKLATQMGNQGSAENGLRRAVEVIQAGVIGAPKELHVWANRPLWGQGMDRPPGHDKVPANLDWDVWLGPSPKRPYKSLYPESQFPGEVGGVYHPFGWRGWKDFGTGSLGDMACHTVNMAFRACKLGYPNVVEMELSSRLYVEAYPKTSRIRFEFPAREGLPPLKFWWYDGRRKDPLMPLRPESGVVHEIVNMRDDIPSSGMLLIGEKGKVYSPDDYGATFLVAMHGEDTFTLGDKHEVCKNVPITLPRLPEDKDKNPTRRHMSEWFTMMRDGTPTYSNFNIAAYLTEVILVGCVALRSGEGARMEWDGPNMRSPNLPGSEQFTKRHNRRGWEA